MKNKIKLFISIFIIIQTIFSIKSIAVESSTNPNYTSEQKAIREVADAYYRRGINAQYSSERSSRVSTPEETTYQNMTYSMCSGYAFDIYYQAFGIKLPVETARLIAYGEKFYNQTNDVIEYWQKETDEDGDIITDENGKKIYKDNENHIKNIDLSSEEGREAYGKKLLTEYNLQIGDIICYHNGIKKDNEGHTMIVYDIIYDEENGEPVDAIIREATSNFERKTTKITKGLSYTSIYNYNEKNNIFEGVYREWSLINEYKTNSNTTRKPILYYADRKPNFVILRPLQKDENGEYYYHATMTFDKETEPAGYKDVEHTREEYKITNTTLKRIEYSGIYIEKTVDKFNDSIVNIGDTLEYTIKIMNKSNTINNVGIKYNSFDIIENISDYVEVIDNGDGIIEGKTIKWNVSELEHGESIEKKYKVKVKQEKEILEKEIISTGTVAGIPSSTIKNVVSNNLNETQKYKIKNSTENLFNEGQYNNEQLISMIYGDSLGIDDIEITSLDITNLIKITSGSGANSISLNDNSNFRKMIIGGYYGSVYSSGEKVSLRGYIKTNITSKIEATEEKRSERAENIYKENFQTGDILIYKNTQTANDRVLYKTEDGTYYLIYVDEEDKITVNGQELYGFIGINENGEINNIYRDELDYESDTDYSINDLRTLLGKDYYVILRPSMVLDIVPMELQISYDNTDITNQDVQVVITSNEEILPVEGWTLSEDKKILTKIYTQNTNEELKVYDYGGNEKIVNIKIENIDKEKPTLDISYSITKATNKDVIVTINSNEELKNVSGWTLSEDRKTLTKTYTENKSENIEVTDIAGNISTAIIDIKNIDREKPIIGVKYSTKEKTLNDVIVAIEANEELQEIEGWQLSDDKKLLNKTYTKNDEETITIYDLAGNSIVESIKVENIDKEKPQYEVKYSTTLSTNEDVTVTITANEEIQSVDGWTLSEDKKVLTKTYTENTEEEIIIKDIVGNSASKTIVKINNIDKIKPEINISYSITKLTNQDIIVTITANEEIKEIEGWNLSTDKKELKKKFTSNTEKSITISDLAENTISDTIKISNIDKVTPKTEVKYSTTAATDKAVIVTITSDKIIRNVEGWILSSDKKQLTKNFKENGEEKITITDEAGNSVTTNIKVSNIDKTEAKQVDTKATSNNDTTTAKMILPNTGEKSILIFIVIFMILSTIMYIKLKKYKNVK